MFGLLLILIVLKIPNLECALICSRYPPNTFTPKSPVDENFVISVSGNPQTYILGQEYNISLSAFNGHRYVSFILALENDNGDASYNDDLGRFELSDTVETRFSPKCINMVESTNNNPKTHIDVTWVAPSQQDSGCILIRATLLQHRDVWYMDDGGLTKRLCREVVDDVESQSIDDMATPCCACDEARYELKFEGTWSRNLHPKDFPIKGWTTRFSDIIGVAHMADYRFWEYGKLATEGMQEFAEHGSARLLEGEFSNNFKDGKIRTIIKARGLSFPNLNGQSVASIRVDPQHHLVSLASKIDPSPDWIVGVSGLELCMANCTWLEQKIVNLYPWDIGTDAGPSYTSADQPQIPADVIRRMRSDFPNDPRSPFFNQDGSPMKPLATLTIKRQRLYERLCEDEESNTLDVSRECVTHPWSSWTQCTAKCGEGRQYRMRVYKQPDVAKIYKCDAMMVNRQDRTCIGSTCAESERVNNFERDNFKEADVEFVDENYGERSTRAECQLGVWLPWSPCSKTCGEGKMMRRRQYLNAMSEKKCQNARFVKLFEHKKCVARDCLGEITRDRWNGERDTDVADTVGENTDTQQFNSGNMAESGYVRPYAGGAFQLEAQNEENEGLVENGLENSNPNYASNFEVGNLNKISSVENQQEVGNTYARHNQNDINYRVENSNLLDGQNFNTVHSRHQNPNQYQPVLQVPAYCYQSLHLFNCLDSTVTGNFWFYNYCEDECMLYAADSCDRNDNKFTTLEMCELRCRQPGNASVLRLKQLQDCFSSKAGRKNQRKNNRRNNRIK